MADSGLFGDTIVIGKGGYGCVVKPVKICKDEDINTIIRENERIGKKYVSKIFTQRSVELEETISRNIKNNKIANRASSEAIKVEGVTPDFGMEIFRCELETKPVIPKCSMELTEQSLILSDLGSMDAKEITGRKKEELLSNLMGITIEDMERAVNSNLINISCLHKLGYVDLDIHLANLIPNFDRPFSFKIIDYDTFQQINSIDAFGYSHVTYFYPPEYIVFGNSINGRIDLKNNLKDILRRFDGSLRPVLWERGAPMPAVIKARDKQIKGIADKVWEENAMTLLKIKEEFDSSEDKYNIPELKELVKSVDYFMYSIAIYTFIYELKVNKSIEEHYRWDKLLERISNFFHPKYNLRLDAIQEFLDRGTI